jgi:diacylglycerol kinase family enzyme
MEKQSVDRKIKRILHILNPVAGKCRAAKIKSELDGKGSVYMSESAEEATDFMINACRENPDTCFTVYGGDGTVFKAVNALMKSGYNDRAQLKIVPVGSGNDFVKTFEGKKGEIDVDVMKFNDKYAVNVINMGFDCSVVQRAGEYKKSPLVSGKFSYILGTIAEAFNKQSMNVKVTVTYEDDSTESFEGKTLLVAVANGMWYGGGFKVAPASKTDDGLLDFVMVKDVSILKFASLVGDYKKGTHINPETMELKKKYRNFMIYKHCKKVKVEGCGCVCADGEIFNENEVEISVIPKALHYVRD